MLHRAFFGTKVVKHIKTAFFAFTVKNCFQSISTHFLLSHHFHFHSPPNQLSTTRTRFRTIVFPRSTISNATRDDDNATFNYKLKNKATVKDGTLQGCNFCSVVQKSFRQHKKKKSRARSGVSLPIAFDVVSHLSAGEFAEA